MHFTRESIRTLIEQGHTLASTTHGRRRLIGTAEDYALAKDEAGKITQIRYSDIRDVFLGRFSA